MRLGTLAAAVLLAAGSAQAGLVGYKMEITGSYNLPYFEYKNLSSYVLLTEAKITIGDTRYNFDNGLFEGFKSPGRTTFYSAPAGSFTQFGPDEVGSGSSLRSDAIRYAFSSAYLFPNETFRWRSDIDVDARDSTEDFRRILFDQGGNASWDNALVWVKFSDGTILQRRLPDFPLSATSFTVTQTITTPAASPVAVPLPAGAWLGIGGLVFAALWTRGMRCAGTMC